MFRPLALTAALAAALALSPAAWAKGISDGRICGESGCAQLRDPSRLDMLMGFGSPVDPPAEGARWYELRVTLSHGPQAGAEPFTFRHAYVPGARLVRVRAEDGRFQWLTADRRLAAYLDRAAARVEPFPAGRLRGLAGDLAVQAPAAQVHAVVMPPERAPDGSAGSAGWTPPLLIAGAVGAAGLASLLARRVRRRRVAAAAG